MKYQCLKMDHYLNYFCSFYLAIIWIMAGGLAVSQQIPMANAGHGPMQGRPTQGNNQVRNYSFMELLLVRNINFFVIFPFKFANRYPMRGPGNLARPSMPGTAINPNHPPNTPSMPYPNASPGLNVIIWIFL